MFMSISSALFRVRTASVDDAGTIFSLVQALADYEKLAHEVVGNAAAIATHSGGDTDYTQAGQRPYIATLLAEVEQIPVGLALFFPTYSIRADAPGYYLEDLFVLPEYRKQGVGKTLLRALAQYTLSHNCRELRWSVLDWNELAIAFYQKIGAEISEHCRICRFTGEALQDLARSGARGTSDRESNVRLVPPDELSEVLGQIYPLGWRFSTGVANGSEGEDSAQQIQKQVDALVDHGSIQSPRFEVLQVTQGDRLLGFALFTHSYSTFLTQPGMLVEAIATNPNEPSGEAEQAIYQALAQLTVERQSGRLEWYVDDRAAAAVDRYQQWGATVLPDWRICRLEERAIANLAQS